MNEENKSQVFAEQQINAWINNKGIHGVISDNSKIAIFNNNISGGTSYVHGYNNSNISLFNNNCISGLYNVIGLQNSRITNLFNFSWKKVETTTSIASVQTLPTPTIDLLGKVYKYTGTSTSFTKNDYYICILNGTNYIWNKIEVNEVKELPEPTVEGKIYKIKDKYYQSKEKAYAEAYILPYPDQSKKDQIYKYIGLTTEYYINGSFYKCTLGGEKDKLPTATSGNINVVYRYIGETTNKYTYGNYYQCAINENYETTDILPGPKKKILNVIYKFTGDDYSTNHYYQCKLDGDLYKWNDVRDSIMPIIELPIASEEYLNIIYKFAGTTDYQYKNGNYYICIKIESVDKMHIPTPSATYLNNIFRYVGTTGTYTKNNYYKCVKTENTENSYQWIDITDNTDQNLWYTWQEMEVNVITSLVELPMASIQNILILEEYTEEFKQNQYYKCVESEDLDNYYYWKQENIYYWKNVNTQYYWNNTTVDNYHWINITNLIQHQTELPVAAAYLSGMIYQYIGETYIQNQYYKCVLNNGDNDTYQSQVTSGTIYNFPETNRLISGNITSNQNDLKNNFNSYISSIIISNKEIKTDWVGLLINGGDRLYFDKNVHHMYKNIKENYVFNTISDELINYLPKNLNRIKCYI